MATDSPRSPDMEKLKRSGWFWWMTIDSQGVAVLVDLFRAASLDKYKIDAAIFLLQELNGFEYVTFGTIPTKLWILVCCRCKVIAKAILFGFRRTVFFHERIKFDSRFGA